MLRLLPAGVLLLVVVGVSADDAASKKMLKELEGSYKAVSMSKGGEPAPDEFLKAISFSVKGDTFTVTFKKADANEDKAATVVIDSSKKPVSIDLTPKDGPEAGKPMLGIIKVEKDSITLCWTDRGEKTERPKEFTSTKENKQFLIVMKKSK
ncbi:MAG: TIGR03067 domain-containing protein [Gemmataceae bacterium]|nr:TIGR03067 domain-containing protein [Gemmataceae bacterium]